MSRRHRHRKESPHHPVNHRLPMNDYSTRDDWVHRSHSLRRLSVYPTLSELQQDVEDLRSLPHDVRPNRYLTVSGRPAGIVYAARQPALQPVDSLRDVFPSMYPRFQDPRKVLVCVRRQLRRAVLFALRAMGKGRGGSKRAVWTEKSYISCK